MVTWHNKSISDILKKLKSSEDGLSEKEANFRLKKYGFNTLPANKGKNFFIIFLSQFKSPLIYILIAAGAVILAIGEIADGLIILVILIFNSVIGTTQEGKAQNALLALNKFTQTKSTVLRNGKEIIIDDNQVVIGDILIIQEGEKVSADARLINANNLKIDESSLTGESIPTHKTTNIIKKINLPAPEQKNMVFKGTNVVSGNGKAIVVATSLNTVIGKIAKKIENIDTETPLKKNIEKLSKSIIIITILISLVIFSLGLILGQSIITMFTVVVSLAVSIIPEGLPIVITLVLATGVWRMSKRNALVKKLQAVEALGQAQIIAVDKTGTITKNELVVQKAYLNGNLFDISGIGYQPNGNIKLKGKIINVKDFPELTYGAKLSALCSNARVMYSEEDNIWKISGDPTEAAIITFAEKIGLNKDGLEMQSEKISEMPFDYKLKYKGIIIKENNQNNLFVMGAPESILKISSKIILNGKAVTLTKEKFKELENIFKKMSESGLRVIAMARAKTKDNVINDPKSLEFVGFLGMRDALRLEIKNSIIKANLAGIKVVMITGDHKITARAIAKEAGIFKEGDEILTGEEIDNLSDVELAKKIISVSVYSRVTPDNKLRIINSYRSLGLIVAMTGDGVNDAPSLVAADLGISMGKIGTEVAKEAADIVLLDDNFNSIVSAVEEGRNIYKTIKKVMLYLFSTGLGEVLTIAVSILIGLPIPLIAAQIIWLNFVTDGFLDVALAMEKKESGLLNEKLKSSEKNLLDNLMVGRIITMALPMMFGTIYLFYKNMGGDISYAWTVSLCTLAVFQWFNAWNCRSESKSIFQTNPFSNKYLIYATIIVILLQIVAVYNPLVQKILHTTALDFGQWLIIIPVAFSIIVVEEIRKFFYRRYLKSLSSEESVILNTDFLPIKTTA
ncbi:MAG: HAD-IC family P-type ATPase [Candidatus Buchananbacteria bacterium]